MQSFLDIDKTFAGQPRELGAVLARVDLGRGQEILHAHQRPQLLQRLSEHARIASITASTAIEGIDVDPGRAEKIVDGASRFRNRSEKEFAGYRDAVDGLMRAGAREPLTVPFLLHLHRELFKYADGRGGYLKRDSNVIVTYESGRRDVVFEPPAPEQAELMLVELLARYEQRKVEATTHPLLLLGALVLDLLAIDPVADGNGRLARLVTTHELLEHGYGVARYVSVEERILASKHTYCERLYASQRGWHEATHDVWPWVDYLARVLAGAYEDFEGRLASVADEPEGKQDRVREHILNHAPAEFRRRDVERALPEISPATVRLVIKALRDEGAIELRGTGSVARWRRS